MHTNIAHEVYQKRNRKLYELKDFDFNTITIALLLTFSLLLPMYTNTHKWTLWHIAKNVLGRFRTFLIPMKCINQSLVRFRFSSSWFSHTHTNKQAWRARALIFAVSASATSWHCCCGDSIFYVFILVFWLKLYA